MTCPSCQHPRSRVVNSRRSTRRRECLACRIRWTTLETLAAGTVAPLKKITPKSPPAETKNWLERLNEKLA